MKQKLFIFVLLVLMAVVLIGLNAVSYTPKDKAPESEFSPNRSTFNSGATGTQAFYSLLSETGRKTVRWQEPPAALFTAKTNLPAVFVVVGTVKRDFTEPEVEVLLRWVASGGRLVLIDREPPAGLLTTTANWVISFEGNDSAQLFAVDPTDQKQMTHEASAARPLQPTVLAHGVNAIQPSRFAAAISFKLFIDKQAASQTSTTEDEAVESVGQFAPVAHFASNARNLVVDAPFGDGRIVFLSDPYIVSNGGISLVDNAQLAVNLVAAGDQLVAFDEYHHGYGVDSNRFLQFFAGTPIIAIFLQAAVLVGFIFFSQSRRFARPVPEPEPDRLSKLEYVAAMAELQRRTKAFDLAIENIYNEFRRRVTRKFGLDNFTAKSGEIAAMIAERSGLDRAQVADVLHQCEEIIRGEATNRKEVVRLADELRSIEKKLGMTRAGRTRI